MQQSLLHQPSNRRRVWHSCHTHVALCQSSHRIHRTHRNDCRKYPPTDFTDAHRLGGYGIPAIPTPPSANSPTEFAEPTETTGEEYSPTEFAEPTETTGEEYSPTDFTDAHRWLGCVGFSHRIRRIHRSFWCKMFSHRFHRFPQIFRSRKVLPQNSQNPQKRLGEYTQPENSVKSVNSVG